MRSHPHEGPPVPGYQPVDLSSAADTGRGVLDDPGSVLLGARTLHGIPFRFGSDEQPDGPAFVRVAPGTAGGAGPGGPVRIAIGRRAHWLVFAHALLDSDLFEGGPIGQTCAEYVLHYADGTSARTAVRQRFEIGPTPRDWPDRAIPLDWGQTPFLALPDTEQRLMHRTCGRYDAAGARFVDIDDPQARSPYVLPYRFYLWPWRNPHPERVVETLEIRPLATGLLLGALTTSDLGEDPFGRTVAQNLLLRVEGAPVDENLRVEVDRGLATYVYRVVDDAGDEARDTACWGGVSRSRDDMAYVRVAAVPSATLTVRSGERTLGRCSWSDLLTSGRAEPAGEDGAAVALTLTETGRTWVRTTVVDDETGEPVPCRIHFHTLDGVPAAPYGHHAHINSDGNTWNLDIGGDVRLGAKTYAYVDGSCEGWMPLGEVVVEIARGFEYRPVREVVTIEPGQRELRLRIGRVADMPARGYFSGDTHVHFVSTLGAEAEARGEDVHVVNLLLSQWGHLYTNTEDFTGHPHTSADGGTIVYAGQENRTNMLGHINLLGLRRPVMPWCTGGAEESDLGGGLETTLSHWADECHDQGGTVVLAHFPVPNGEAAALLATGRLDAVEMIAYDEYNIQEYYRYLNCGYRIPLVGGTDKMSSEVPIGLIRTYVRTGGEGLDYWTWCDGIRRGDTFVTSGPLVTFTVNGSPAGARLRVAAGDRVRVEAEVESIFDIDRLEIVANGDVVATHRLDTPERRLRLTAEVDITEDGWLAARTYGPGDGVSRHQDVWRRPIMAHTSPVYVSVGERYDRFNAETARYMLTLVDGATEHIVERSRRFWPGPVHHRHGREDHLAYLLEPLEEARAAIVGRLREHGEVPGL